MLVVRFINNPNSLKIEGFKSLSSITLSPYWLPVEPNESYWRQERAFKYRGGDAAIYLSSRTQALAPEDAQLFRDTIISGTHALMDTEWKRLKAVFGDLTNPKEFSLQNADVIDWNGRLVVLVQGEWKDFDLRCYTLFIDATNDGRYVEEVIYQAPTHIFNSQRNEAMLALQSIEWNSTERFVR